MEPKLPVSVLTLLGICILLSIRVDGVRMLSKQEHMELDRQLNILNKPPVQSFEIDGDIFDCIDFYKQPAFDHPLLKNHKIQMMPSSFSEGDNLKNSSTNAVSITNLKVKECPSGTVLIRRTKKEDLIRAKLFSNSNILALNATTNGAINYRAQLRMARDHYYGSKAHINVYALPDVKADQGTSSSIFLLNGFTGSQSDLNAIQAGWEVIPSLHGDTRTRLYAYWTADGGISTGCLNTLCPGFVQVSKQITVGSLLEPLSTYKGTQYYAVIVVFRDPKNGNWWMSFGDGPTIVGYWPSELFKSLATEAGEVAWGGVVFSPTNEPSPPMGNGHKPFEEGARDLNACHFKKLTLVNDKFMQYEPPEFSQSLLESRPDCYSLTKGFTVRGDGLGFRFYFGGRGGCTS